ncbi:glycosyl hydrolase family 3 C-terminal domain-containing protein [Aspergillus desertorum]
MKLFTMAVQDSVPWTAMVSCPKINVLHADLSPEILPRLLRNELQYGRLVMSDWGGLNNTVESLLATTDLEMPGPPVPRGQHLLDAIQDGRIDVAAHVDPSVRRVLQLLERTGLLQSPGSTEKSEQTADDPFFHQIAREAAQSGLVLLKNTAEDRNLGPNARTPTAEGAGSAAVNPFYVTTPEECLRSAIQARTRKPRSHISPESSTVCAHPFSGDLLTVPDGSRKGLQASFFAGHAFQGPVVATSFRDDSSIYLFSDGDVPASLIVHPYCYRATGLVTPRESGRYTWSLANTGRAKLFLDDELLVDNARWTKTTDNVVTLPLVDAFDNTLFPRVSGVRIGLALERDESSMLEQAVASAREAEVAVVAVGHNRDSEGEGGDRAHMQLPGRPTSWLAAVCAANSNTVVVVQTGTPYHVSTAAGDYGFHAWFPGEAAQGRNTFGEGVLVEYRHFDAQGVEDVRISGTLSVASPGSTVSVHARVANVGDRDGQEVVQVYVSPSAQIAEMGLVSYPKTLAGFRKIAVPRRVARNKSTSTFLAVMDLTPVACLKCREKHLKCDGVLGGCGRCQSLGLPCHFVPSRRGRKAAAVTAGCLRYGPGSGLAVHLALLSPLSRGTSFPPPNGGSPAIQSSSYLLNIMEFVSMHYLSPHFFHDSSGDLLAAVQAADLTVEKPQALLLLAIARSCLGQALHCALELGLHRREASDTLSVDAPLRAESPRRTWWEIFVVDLEMTETPRPGCTVSPILPTFADMERNSLFCSDIEFSPCAYRIEAAMMLQKCLHAGGTHVAKETLDGLSAAITAWFHRLPSSRRPVLQPNGVVDENHDAGRHDDALRHHLPTLFSLLPLDFSARHRPYHVFISARFCDHLPQLSTAHREGGGRWRKRSCSQMYLALNLGVLKSMGETWPIAASALQRIRQAAIEVSTTVPCDARSLLGVFTSAT